MTIDPQRRTPVRLDPDLYLSRHHRLADLIGSETAAARGLDNTPPAELLDNLRRLAAGLDRVRELLGHPLQISSAYRSPQLNAAVGGVPESMHTRGLAADFACEAFGPPITIARAIDVSSLEFDQCILEYGRWVHLAFADSPRRRVLSIYDAKAGYQVGIWDETGNRVA